MASYGFGKFDPLDIRGMSGKEVSVRDRYNAMAKRAQEEALQEAVKQAQINEGERRRMTKLQYARLFPGIPLALSSMESYSGLAADDLQNRQRKAAGVGGTLKILQNLPKGEKATLSEGTEPGKMVGRSATELEKRLQEEGKLQEEDKLRALKELQQKRAALGDTGFARYMIENPLANPSNWR